MSDEEYWDDLAERYDALYDTPWSRKEDSELGELLRRALGRAPGTSVLDVGCGTGLGYKLLSQHGEVDYTGLDISAAMLSKLKRKFPAVKTLHGAADNVGSLTEPACFDLIISVNVAASFVSDPSAFVRSLYNVANAGGIILISFLNRMSLRRLVRLRFSSRETYLTRGDEGGSNPVQANTLSARELRGIVGVNGFVEMELGWRSVLGGVYEGRGSVFMESLLHPFAARFGHEVYILAQRP